MKCPKCKNECSEVHYQLMGDKLTDYVCAICGKWVIVHDKVWTDCFNTHQRNIMLGNPIQQHISTLTIKDLIKHIDNKLKEIEHEFLNIDYDRYLLSNYVEIINTSLISKQQVYGEIKNILTTELNKRLDKIS